MSKRMRAACSLCAVTLGPALCWGQPTITYWTGTVTACGAVGSTGKPFEGPSAALNDAFALCFGNGVVVRGSPPGSCNAPYVVRTDRMVNPRPQPDGTWVADGATEIVTQTGGCLFGAGGTTTSTWDRLYVASPHRVPLLDRWHVKPRSCGSGVGNPIHPLLGTKTQDLELVAGLGPAVRLTYDSSRRASVSYAPTGFASESSRRDDLAPASSFGELWSSSQHRRLEVRAAGVKEVIHASRPGGDWVGFDRTTAGTYVPDADVSDRLIRQAGASGWRYYAMGDALVEDYDGHGLLMRAQRAGGGGMSYAYGAFINRPNLPPLPPPLLWVQDEFGRRASFGYEQPGSVFAEPRIVSLTDAAGWVTRFGYDAAGNLERIAWPDATVRRFLYENPALPWALTGVIDEGGQRLSAYGYDAEGRAVSTELAGGVDRYQVSHAQPPTWLASDSFDPVARVGWRDHTWQPGLGTVLTRPGGSTSSLDSTLVLGQPRLSSQSQPAGAGCAASTRRQWYDAKGNVVQRDDFNGHRSCLAHDDAQREVRRVEGLADTADCRALLADGVALPAGARKISTLWHPDWRLPVKVAEPGRTITLVYNGQPDPFAANGTAACAPAGAVLPDGKPIVVLCKRVEHSTGDGDGSAGFAGQPDSHPPTPGQRVWQWTYNAQGQVLTAVDPLGHATGYAYYTDTAFTGSGAGAAGHTVGDLASITNAAGHVTLFTFYDKSGNWLQSLDPNGVVTTRAFDARQRLRMVSVGGETTAYEYWPNGLLRKVTQPDGGFLSHEYDAAQRLTGVSDHLGNRIEYVLDHAGNRTAENVKDPGGGLRRALTRGFDALNRVQWVVGREVAP